MSVSSVIVCCQTETVHSDCKPIEHYFMTSLRYSSKEKTSFDRGCLLASFECTPEFRLKFIELVVKVMRAEHDQEGKNFYCFIKP